MVVQAVHCTISGIILHRLQCAYTTFMAVLGRPAKS